MNSSTTKILRFAVIATSVVAIASATVVAPGSSAESVPRDSRSKIFKQYESLADYAESDGRNPQVWMPETGISKKAWASSIQDESVRVDSEGRALVIDPLHVDRSIDVAPPESATLVDDVPLEDAFLLNSLPGSNRTIYLDFTGHSLVDTIWQDRDQNGIDDYTDLEMQMPPYDVDGDTITFSDLELRNIIDAWSAIAEDYAPFSVNVTTQDPGLTALERTSSSDMVFGVRALITDSANVIGSTCGCGGIAYVDVFDYAYWNTYTGPALNFAQNWFNGKTLSDVVSHEVGHNLGLLHDGGINPPGTVVDGYYEGRDGWAPVMGVGYYEPLVQFSNGTYTSGNNNQDDYAVALGNGLNLRTDDHGDTWGDASALTLGTEGVGFVSSQSDEDYFSFVATETSHEITVSSPSVSSNLDTQLKLYDFEGTLLSMMNLDFVRESTYSTSGLDASLSATTTIGETYYVAVEGVGFGSGSTTGYSDYGSRGEYRILVSGAPLTEATPTISGSGAFGTALTGNAGTWANSPTLGVRWYRNGVPTADTDSSYAIAASDIGKELSFRVVATKPGFNKSTVDSTAVTVTVGTISPSGTAKISGTAKVKKTLTASATGWMSGVSVGYQWLLNGASISSATNSKYKLAKSDKGKRISVRISLSKVGYTSVTATSPQTKKVAG